MCELCNLEKKTEWYFDDDYFIICECETCHVPMIVSKRHTIDLNQRELIDLIWIFIKEVGKDHKLDLLSLDQKNRKIPDHWHIHLR